MAGTDIFGIIVMLVAAGVGIAFLDFILRNLPDALDDSPREFTDSDSMSTPWGDLVALPDDFRGVKAPAELGGGEATSGRGLSVINGSQTGVQTQNQTQSSNKPNNALRNSDLIASQDGQ